MKTENPIHLLKGLKYLDCINLEDSLTRSQNKTTLNFRTDFFIDLSQVRFVELSAVAQLLLIIEKYLKSKSNIYVAVPTISLIEKEKKSDSYSQDLKLTLLGSRKKSNSFLKTIGFINALRDISKIHAIDIYITEQYNFQKEFDINIFKEAFEVVFEKSDVEYTNYKYVFPLEWINCKNPSDYFLTIEKRLDKILENKERGIDSIDVKGIKNVVFSELTKNVKEHSDSIYALFTIGLIKSQYLFQPSQNSKPNPIELEYVSWLKENSIPSQIEIYFGDSGTGILTNNFINKYKYDIDGTILNNEERLKLSFQKWTTLKNDEERRGTKGLYRIQRIVNKYNGLFHITTSYHNGGYRKGGLTEEEWVYRKSNFDFGGTFIQIKLCPYSDVKEFRYVLKDRNSKKRWKTVQYNPRVSRDFIFQFKKDVKTNDNLLIILNLNELTDDQSCSLLENNLAEFSYYSHPCAVVLYILSNLKNDTIQTIVESVNVRIINETGNEVFQEFAHFDAEEVYDPVLVIGDKNETFWFGGNQNLISLLNESYIKHITKPRLSELNEYIHLETELKIRIRLHLENDNKLVNVDKDEYFNFNFTNIDKFFEKEIIRQFGNRNKQHDIFCTPKLEVVENWIEIKELLANNEYGYALTLYLKYRDYVANEIHNLDRNNLFILIDHKQQKELAKAFANLLGVKARNIKNIHEDVNAEIPKRIKLFPEKSKVIVLTTIISSSETTRRLVKYIKRDSAIPDVILCLCNYRKNSITELETWNDKTKIYSIFRKYDSEQTKIIKDNAYYKSKENDLKLNLRLKSPQLEDETNFPIFKIEGDLRDLVVENKIMHYNHIGIYRDRHFTFYLDKTKLLNVESFIWRRISQVINDWKKINDISNFTLYLPKSILPTNNSTSRFLEFLKSLTKRIKTLDEATNISAESNVVYFDFGMMTGKAVNNVITKCTEADNLFICILFNQLKSNDLVFYRRIKTLNNQELFTNLKPKPTNFKIEYLYELPLSYFNSETCPICEHIRALEFYKLNIEYMFKFSEDRQHKLKLIDAEEIQVAEYPYDFYFSTDDIEHELSSELIMKMYEFKILIEKAETSTQQRIYVYDYIFRIYNNISEFINDCNSELFALLYFLSHEINWLQKEPLVFKDLRVLLGDISHKIAIISRDDLSAILKLSNQEKTTSDKLSIRYKYAAISLLRSTNKLLFCKSISQIILSSRGSNDTSNNIIQNTLYHIASLFKNKYNKSKEYFDNIKKGLLEVSSDGLPLNINQKLAIQKIYLINQTKIKEIEFNDAHLDHIYIRNLSDELNLIYQEHHPKPIEYFHKIYLNRYLTIFTEYEKVKEKARNYPTLLEVKTKLVSYWKSTLEFLNNSIFFYLNKLEGVRNSQFFRNYFSNSLNLQDLYQITDRFTELIYLIEDDLNNYNLYIKEYDSLYEKINSFFIKNKGHLGETQDSKIINFISCFPTNLSDAIDASFPISIFPKRVFTSELNCNVFYPNNEFSLHLDLVRNNIEVKKNMTVKLSDIDLKFNLLHLEKNQVELCIMYDSTDKFNKPESKSGSLSNWKKEAEFFQASISYELPKTDNKYFTLKIKLLKYE